MLQRSSGPHGPRTVIEDSKTMGTTRDGVAAGLSAIPAAKSALGSATMSMMRYVGSIAGTVILGWVLASEPSRQQFALYLFAGAFVISALLAIGLNPSGEVDIIAAEKDPAVA